MIIVLALTAVVVTGAIVTGLTPQSHPTGRAGAAGVPAPGASDSQGPAKRVRADGESARGGGSGDQGPATGPAGGTVTPQPSPASPTGGATPAVSGPASPAPSPASPGPAEAGRLPGHGAPVRGPEPGPRPAKLDVLTGTVPVIPAANPHAATSRVGLRALIIALDNNDAGLATWKSQLNQIGVPYDTLLARSENLTESRLLRAGGGGRYNAILLTNNSLLLRSGGSQVSAFGNDEWNILWNYERAYQVRQVVLYSSYGTFPEDTCLRQVGDDEVGETPQLAYMSEAGADLFDYLDPDAEIPIASADVFHTSIARGCDATQLLGIDGNVIGITSRSSDGRERAALTFSAEPDQTHTTLLGYGLVRWATRGVFLGEQRHWLNVDVDDWYNTTAELQASGSYVSGGYRNTVADVTNLVNSQQTLGQQYPEAEGFKINLAYNAAGANQSASKSCPARGGADPLTTATYCNRDQLRFINHTYSHKALDDTDYTTTYNEIARNLTAGQQLGLSVPETVLKTPEFSGLGTYTDDPADAINPPTDHGLQASNPALMQAVEDLGIKYVHGDMSFASHRPGCFNCGLYHPMANDVLVVPDWPTNIWYFSSTPDEETYFYNRYYGPNGLYPQWSRNFTYQQIIEQETKTAAARVMSGSAYSYTMHVGNLRNYSGSRSLVFDWVTSLVGKYSAYYQVPLRNPAWLDLAQYVANRTSHFAALADGLDAVWDRTTDEITITGSGTVFLTGTSEGLVDEYGTDVISAIPLTEEVTTVAAEPRD